MEKPREWLREKSIAKKVLTESNLILEVVDARIPIETRNKVVEDLVIERNKSLIVVLNKVDLVPREFIEKARSLIEKDFPVVLFSAHKKFGGNELLSKIREIAKERGILKVGVLGYPNVGKSSVMNLLKGKKVATTSPKPGMTRGETLVKLEEGIFLLDTPGIITLEHPENLALKCAWIPEKLQLPVEVSLKLLEKICQERPQAIKETYRVEPEEDPLITLEKIATKLNYKAKGGELDLERTAKKVLWDWIKGFIKAYWI